MSGSAVALPDKLVFSYHEEECRAFDRLVWARRDPGPHYLNFKAAMTAITFAVGFVVLAGNHLGFVRSDEMPEVLFAAYAAFIAGAVAHRAAMQLRYRATERAMFRDIAAETFEVTFDGSAIAYGNARYQLRAPWASVADVLEASLVVVLMFDYSQGVSIPARLFADQAARTNFVAAVRERASGARLRT